MFYDHLGTVQILRNHRGGEGRKFFEIFDYARTCPVFSIGGTCDYGVAGGGRVDPEKSKIFDYVIFGRSLRGGPIFGPPPTGGGGVFEFPFIPKFQNQVFTFFYDFLRFFDKIY